MTATHPEKQQWTDIDDLPDSMIIKVCYLIFQVVQKQRPVPKSSAAFANNDRQIWTKTMKPSTTAITAITTITTTNNNNNTNATMGTNKDSGNGVTSTELAIISKQSNLNKGTSFSAPDQMVTFFVGQLGVKFVVHREFAMRYSPVLRVAFGNPAENGGGIAGGPLNTYQVKDTSPSAFRLFTSWIYTQKLDLKVTHDHALGEMEQSEHKFVVEHLSVCSHQDMDLCELWVLAETFQIPALANLVVKTIYEEHENCFIGVVSPNCYSWVYSFTRTPDSPLRRLLIEMCAWAPNSWQISATPEHYPHQMIVELVERYKTGIPVGLRDSLKAEFDLAEVMVPEEGLSRPS